MGGWLGARHPPRTSARQPPMDGPEAFQPSQEEATVQGYSSGSQCGVLAALQGSAAIQFARPQSSRPAAPATGRLQPRLVSLSSRPGGSFPGPRDRTRTGHPHDFQQGAVNGDDSRSSPSEPNPACDIEANHGQGLTSDLAKLSPEFRMTFVQACERRDPNSRAHCDRRAAHVAGKLMALRHSRTFSLGTLKQTLATGCLWPLTDCTMPANVPIG